MLSPSCAAVIVQVPDATMVMVAPLTSPGPTPHTDEVRVAKLTGSAEVAAALMAKGVAP